MAENIQDLPSETLPNPTEEGKKREKITLPTKSTLNLNMKEKPLISPLLFLPILIVILALAFVIGYFGVYKQYQRVSDAQAELDARKAYLQQILDSIADYDDVKKEYNRYNYEGYDKTIPDPLDVIDLLERNLFPVSSIRSLAISGRTVSMSITGLELDQVSQMIATLEADDLVEQVNVSTTGFASSDSDVVPTVNMTITLADASKGGK